jgi:mRNA interferase MazF
MTPREARRLGHRRTTRRTRQPRPALVIQSDAFDATSLVALLPLTSTLKDADLLRVTLEPDAANNLRQTSQVEIDRCTTADRRRIGPAFGEVDDARMRAISSRLAAFLGIA